MKLNFYKAVEKEIDDLKVRNKGLEQTLEELKSDNFDMKKIMLKLFAKTFEIDDLDDLINLKVNTEYDTDLTESELKEQNKRDNDIIQYILKVKKDLE